MTEQIQPIEEFDDLFGGENDADPSKVRARLEQIMRADIRHVLDGKNNVLPFDQWPEDEAQSLLNYSVSPNGTVNVRFMDKTRAADMLAKMDGLYKKNEEDNPLHRFLKQIPRVKIRFLKQELEKFDADFAKAMIER